MTAFQETRFLPYTPEQLFELVGDIEKYPEFLPLCVGARIRESRPDMKLADLVIGFKAIRERFTSKVTLDLDGLTIDAEMVDGPFHHLTNHWHFHESEHGGVKGTTVNFNVDFAFKSRILSRIIEPLFAETQKRLVSAFEKRAANLYG
jgi:coenzyme Q-binding protein COQ10